MNYDYQDSDEDFDDDVEDWAKGDESETYPCPYCKREIHEDTQRCPYCEKYISEEEVLLRRPLWIILGVVICLAIIGIWILTLPTGASQ